MFLSELEIFNFRSLGCDGTPFRISFNKGLVALVGENDSGKTAIIDAIRYALGTTDNDWLRIEDTDFSYEDLSREISIKCKFNDLSDEDKRAFVEYLTYEPENDNEPVLYLTWSAKVARKTVRGKKYKRVEVSSGKNGDGAVFQNESRQLLLATYLRPLRDAGQEMTSGYNSRLSQVLMQSKNYSDGEELIELCEDSNSCGKSKSPFCPESTFCHINHNILDKLSVLGITDLMNALLQNHSGITKAQEEVNSNLNDLKLTNDNLRSSISVANANDKPEVKLKKMLEMLTLSFNNEGKSGLGSENLLYIACELLLLAAEAEGLKLLLIEEPEAHLHAQRQLRVVKYLQNIAQNKDIQVILTTHSPHLAASIKTENLILVEKGNAFSLAPKHTKLESGDYSFLNRFLDATKANLFFAKGVLIVEGDAENILLPTIAELTGYNLTEHGISIVNVGNTAFRRYARIFMRNIDEVPYINIPVACITDMDVMPDCAPKIIGKIKEGEDIPPLPESTRKWRCKSDFHHDELNEKRSEIKGKSYGQNVKTFVSDEWTLEYDLAFLGLANEVYYAAKLAIKESRSNSPQDCDPLEFKKYITELSWSAEQREEKSSEVYALFSKNNASKAISAQYLCQILNHRYHDKPEKLIKRLPKYLIDALKHVTGTSEAIDND